MCLCNIDNIFIIGGYCLKNDYVTSSCIEFDTNEEHLFDKNWREIAKMKEARYSPACVVFQENIVVSGGEDVNEDELNTVESYDVFANKWTSMPNMVNVQSDHNLVVIKDRLFVIGYGNNKCELFNNDCKKFVALKSPNGYIVLNKAMSIGNRVVVFQKFRSKSFYYDINKDEWYEVRMKSQLKEVTNFLKNYCSCAKLPWY